MSDKPHDPNGVGTTGHEWDGIRELNNPLPRWWLLVFYACILFSLVWVILYPALPGLHGNSPGVLRASARADLQAEMAAVEAQRARALSALDAMPVADIPQHPVLMKAAVEGGRAAFKLHCSQCHGSGAAGAVGYPNLNDDDWLWGGSMDAIHSTISHGIRHPGDDTTRVSIMPAFGTDGLLTGAQIADVAEHVLAISGQQADAAKAARGAVIFEQQCAACHGPAGKGMREFGAPNLTDGIWLKGGDRAAITGSISRPRMGVMPAWHQRLDERTIRKLTAYVHSLGGGE